LKRYVDIAAFSGSLLAIGVGVALKDMALALVVVGSIGVATVFAAQFSRKPQPTGEPKE
jgi:hypothetical protein